MTMSRLGLLSVGLFVAVLFVSGTEKVSAIDCGTAKSHDAFFGNRQPGDQLLWTDHVTKSSKFLRVVEADFSFPSRGDPQRKQITRIELYDQYTDGNGGCGYITSGGVGSSSVSLHIKSQRSKGIDFTVKIFGY